jgi:perosamine synthetase
MIRIPLSSPDINELDILAVTDVLRTTRLSLGPKLEEFEHGIAEYCGSSNAVAVSSGTAALHLCIRALGIAESDEVIVPSFAFIAVANAVRYERAVPVFVDIEPKTFNLDPNKFEAAITPRTRAVIVVHTFGFPADLGSILEIAKHHSLRVIEDACEAIGAEHQGRKVGTLGDVGVFAFYPNKQITTGEGGAVVTNNSHLASLVRNLRNHGRDDSENWTRHTELGYNYRISELNCALGCEQLKRIEATLIRREQIAAEYSRKLGGSADFDLPPLSAPRGRISWFAYVIRLADKHSATGRDRIIRVMGSRGIELGRYFAPIHLQPAYREFVGKPNSLALTEVIALRVLALPFFHRISPSQIGEVCESLVESISLIEETPAPHSKRAHSAS